MPHEIPYWAAGLYAVLGAAAIALGGGLVGSGRFAEQSSRGVWPAAGAGFLIALGVLGVFPEACEQLGSIPLAGALAALAFGGLLFAHGMGHRETHAHPAGAHGHGTVGSAGAGDRLHGAHAGLSLHDARLAVIGLALHALLDGVAVSASLATEHREGILLALFLLLHKVPEGATAAALTYASGGAKRTARLGVTFVAAASLLGGLTIFVLTPVLSYALALTAGVTAGVGVGIATHLLKADRRRALWGFAIGAGLFTLSETLLHT